MKKIIASLLICLTALTACTGDTADTADSGTYTSSEITSADTADTDNEGSASVIDPISDTVTASPKILLSTHINDDSVMFMGICEKNSLITVKGEYTEEFTVTPDGGNFLFSVKLNNRQPETLSIIAKAGDKEASEPISAEAKFKRGEEDKEVFTTYDSRICQNEILDDLYHTNLFTNKELILMQRTAQNRVTKAKKAAGKDVEIIYVIVPNPLTVYSEGVPEDMKSNIEGEETSLTQAVEALRSVSNVTVIDLTDAMNDHKNEKIYYNTDTHWTELGAYYGYEALMKEIAKKFPSAAPHPLSDYDVKNVAVTYTDMMSYAGIEDMGLTETAPFLISKYTPLSPYDSAKKEEAYIWNFTDEFFSNKTSHTEIDNDALPKGMFLFDSYGLNAIHFIAEHFSSLTCMPIWNYSVDYDIIEEEKPDYIIQLISERTSERLLLSE